MEKENVAKKYRWFDKLIEILAIIITGTFDMLLISVCYLFTLLMIRIPVFIFFFVKTIVVEIWVTRFKGR